MIISKTQKQEIALRNLLQKRKVVKLQDMLDCLRISSGMTVSRYLKNIKHTNSYNHAGAYYACSDVPQYNKDGVWCYKKAFFSKYGSLKSTIAHLVTNSKAGFFSKELMEILKVRTKNTLRNLVDQSIIARTNTDKGFLYVSIDNNNSKKQIANRHTALKRRIEIDPYITIQILLKVIETKEADPIIIAKKVKLSYGNITLEQVNTVFENYDVKKN